MNIREFQAGQTAYIYEKKRGKERGYSVTPCTIKSIGRIYVKTDSYFGSQYKSEDWFPDGLVEKVDFGVRRYLFPSMEAIDRYREKIEILAWFGENFCNVAKWKQYSLEALRAAKKDLETGK